MLDLGRKSFENTTFSLQHKREPDRYKCELFRGHILAYLWGKVVLIDTGSERSYGNFTTHLWGKIDLPRTIFGGISLDSLEKFLNFKVDALLGNDYLSNVDWAINLEKGEFTIYSSKAHVQNVDIEVPVKDYFGVPVVPLNVDGKNCEAIFDTGAPISYFSPSLVEGLTPTRFARDFFPLIGSFGTPIFKKSVAIGQASFNIEVGTLPKKLSLLLSTFADKQILGNEVVQHFEIVFSGRGRDRNLLLKRLQGDQEEQL